VTDPVVRDPQIFTATGCKFIAGYISDVEAQQRLIDAGWTAAQAWDHVSRWLMVIAKTRRGTA
jgi:hypothetical protein